MPKSGSLFPTDDNYTTFLRSLKERIRQAQIRAALAVNNELIVLYWQMGQEILSRQQQEGWGSKVSKSCGALKFLSPLQADGALRNFPFGTHFRLLRTPQADGESDP